MEKLDVNIFQRLEKIWIVFSSSSPETNNSRGISYPKHDGS